METQSKTEGSRRRRPLGPLKLLQFEFLPWIRPRVRLQLSPLLPLVLFDGLARLGRQTSSGDRSGGSRLREGIELLGGREGRRSGWCRCLRCRTEVVLRNEGGWLRARGSKDRMR